MPALTLNQMFGKNVDTESIFPADEYYVMSIDLADFQNLADGGDIDNDLGISNLANFGNDVLDNSNGIGIFYAIMLLIMQNQASGKDDDPEQKMYIAESGVSIVNFGNRQGQLERRFTVSIFSDGNFGNTADIDGI